MSRQSGFLKKWMPLLFIFVIFMNHSVFANDAIARTVRIFSVEGDEASVSREGVEASARAGLHLRDGNTLTTGENSSIMLNLDTDSLMRMDKNTTVAVDSIGNRLTLNVINGYALVHAAPQEPDQSLEIREGSRGLTVRGTMFTIGQNDDGITTVVMLSGAGEIGDIWLDGGDMLRITPYDEEGSGNYIYEVIRGFSVDSLDKFTLEAVVDYEEYLTRVARSLSVEMASEAQDALTLIHREESALNSGMVPVTVGVEPTAGLIMPTSQEAPISTTLLLTINAILLVFLVVLLVLLIKKMSMLKK